MIRYKGIGKHNIIELEKIIAEKEEELHQRQLKIQSLMEYIDIILNYSSSSNNNNLTESF